MIRDAVNLDSSITTYLTLHFMELLSPSYSFDPPMQNTIKSKKTSYITIIRP